MGNVTKPTHVEIRCKKESALWNGVYDVTRRLAYDKGGELIYEYVLGEMIMLAVRPYKSGGYSLKMYSMEDMCELQYTVDKVRLIGEERAEVLEHRYVRGRKRKKGVGV